MNKYSLKYRLFLFLLATHFFGQRCFALQTLTIADNRKPLIIPSMIF